MPRWTPSIKIAAPPGVVVMERDPLPAGTAVPETGDVAGTVAVVASPAADVVAADVGTAEVATPVVVEVVATAVVVTAVVVAVVVTVVVGVVVVMATRVGCTEVTFCEQMLMVPV